MNNEACYALLTMSIDASIKLWLITLFGGLKNFVYNLIEDPNEEAVNLVWLTRDDIKRC